MVEEINLLKKFSNPHIIRFIEAFENPGEVILIRYKYKFKYKHKCKYKYRYIDKYKGQDINIQTAVHRSKGGREGFGSRPWGGGSGM